MKTPFFSAFGTLLFGRRAHRKQPEMPEDLNLLRGVFGSHVPKGALAQAKSGANSRRRFFSTDATFWAFLFQVLSPDCACREVVRKLQAWWTGSERKKMAAGTAAYCQARGRLKLPTLEKMFHALAATLERCILERERWLGKRRVKILDGTSTEGHVNSKKNGPASPQETIVARFRCPAASGLARSSRGQAQFRPNQSARKSRDHHLRSHGEHDELCGQRSAGHVTGRAVNVERIGG